MKQKLRTMSDSQLHMLIAALHSFVTGITVSPLCAVGVNNTYLLTYFQYYETPKYSTRNIVEGSWFIFSSESETTENSF